MTVKSPGEVLKKCPRNMRAFAYDAKGKVVEVDTAEIVSGDDEVWHEKRVKTSCLSHSICIECAIKRSKKNLVPKAGLEPARRCRRGILRRKHPVFSLSVTL